MKYKSIYVAATSQHVGKTTSTLGLVTAFMKMGLRVGYCKPLGQRFVISQNLKVDKDALLFANVMQFQLSAELHSPVILGSGTVTAFLDRPTDFNFPERIRYAQQQLERDNDLIIYEGTGHPGVGSVVNLSNADVAKMVDAGVIIVVEGGIGSTIDMLSLCLAKFQQIDVPIVGVIINKVMEDKMEKVHHYVGKRLKKMDIPLLGMMPYDPSLAYPSMKSIAEAINGIVTHNDDMLDNKVVDILAGSLFEVDDLKSSKDLLLVASAQRVDTAIKKIKSLSQILGLQESPVSGIVATGAGSIEGTCLGYIKTNKIPLIRTSLDTYGSVLKISQIEVKINQNTIWKVNRAIEMIEENIDLNRILLLSKL
ncbi:MAG: AAA family ATPase [Saprospiraceae bacterium]|nr:AAA family ATPase [Saprospiraceae bacterium]MBP7680210.1 AAA family ATPase [Saprospiraceae bacterium]